MLTDALTLGTGVFTFVIFLLIQLVSFRWLAPEKLLKSLLLIVAAVMALPIVLMGMMHYLRILEAPLQTWVSMTVLAMVIAGLLCSVYVLCVFGPYETSVRMRLVREIARGKDKGISFQELLSRYSEETMVKIRLKRLLGSGDIIEKDGRYTSGGSGNVFFIFDAIAGVIKKWIGR